MLQTNEELIDKYKYKYLVIIGYANSREYSIEPATRLEDFMEAVRDLCTSGVPFYSEDYKVFVLKKDLIHN